MDHINRIFFLGKIRGGGGGLSWSWINVVDWIEYTNENTRDEMNS